MAQAKVLNEKEIRKVLLYIASKKHSARNRCMFLMTTNCGMRVGEVAALRICPQPRLATKHFLRSADIQKYQFSCHEQCL